MSYQLLKQDVLFYQRFLKANGFYDGKLDGRWGPKTDAADAAFVAKSQSVKADFGAVDAKSESNIVTLIPDAQIAARKFLAILTAAGKDIRILSGTRTYAEQDALYKQGRNGNTLPKVTNAKGGQSNHNFGLAWDIGVFENGNYVGTDSKYKAIPAMVLPQLPQLEWGGNWISFKDFPHYQLKSVSDSVADIRNLFENGTAYV
ncbi:MAG: peptidase and D,D-carboxypeptidase VanY/endolysin [Ferruginibacter sp.]|uniref:M15 family metallopeptidase n=1 Tax=Ferruginibacter sp. TaxID=1940288 RepID=UPI0026596EDA|nr:M15 family metallopeptidase [Ferruginibacter sp.]MDB5279920.1 peptidase and D,D-carboxypeptidase VanY/endolysin [Ferruginibacter sp.]